MLALVEHRQESGDFGMKSADFAFVCPHFS